MTLSLCSETLWGQCELTEIATYLPLLLATLAAGAIGGFAAGLFGIGGGVVIVPALALTFEVLGYDHAIIQHLSVATSLAVVVVTGSSSAWAHYKRGGVMLDVVKVWAPFLVAASLLGGLSARYYSGDLLRIIFGVVALFLAVNMVLPLQRYLMERFAESKPAHRIVAAVIAYVSALMGIGGGSLSVPTLAAFGHTMQKAVGTSSALGVVLAVPGVLGFVVSGWGVGGLPPFSLGFVNVPAFLLVGTTAALIAPYGAALAHKMEQKNLKIAFGLFLAFVGLRMLYQALIAG